MSGVQTVQGVSACFASLGMYMHMCRYIRQSLRIISSYWLKPCAFNTCNNLTSTVPSTLDVKHSSVCASNAWICTHDIYVAFCQHCALIGCYSHACSAYLCFTSARSNWQCGKAQHCMEFVWYGMALHASPVAGSTILAVESIHENRHKMVHSTYTSCMISYG